MALGASGVDLPELFTLSWPPTAGGVSVSRSEAGAKTGTWAGDMGRINGWSGSTRRSLTEKSVTGAVDVNDIDEFKTDVEKGLKVGVVWCWCFSCCSWIKRSVGRRAGDGWGVDSRSKNLTNSSENDYRWQQQTTPMTLCLVTATLQTASETDTVTYSTPSQVRQTGRYTGVTWTLGLLTLTAKKCKYYLTIFLSIFVCYSSAFLMNLLLVHPRCDKVVYVSGSCHL